MLTARDELMHLTGTLTEAEAERVLATIHDRLPELVGKVKTYPVVRGDGRVVRVTVPQD